MTKKTKTAKRSKTIHAAHLSKGNTKLGVVANISLPPIKTCLDANGKAPPCAALCYAMKSERMYAATRDMRARNILSYLSDSEAYFWSIAQQTASLKFFRWHVAGDIVDEKYFRGVIYVALSNPCTKFLIFTKKYDLVNTVLARIPSLPDNLQVVFSAWPGLPMANPFDLPVAFMAPKDGTEERLDGSEIECPGNCETCGMCWSLGSLGRNVVFHQH